MNLGWKWVSLLASAGALGLIGGLMRSRYERDHFVVEETRIFSSKLKRKWNLVFLSDLHDKEFGEGNRRLLDEIEKISPDAVLIGGDMMIAKPGKASLEVTRRLLEGLRGLKGKPEIIYADGNHEQRLQKESEEYGTLYTEFCEMLKELGVIYLSDKTEFLGEDLAVSGLRLDWMHYRNFVPARMDKEYVNRHLGKSDPEQYHILMAHSPMFLRAYADWGADLTLAGHFHGGTIRLPLAGGVMTPQYQFFLPECAGSFEQDGHRMIVSRGLGTHSINIRFNNRPQVVVIRLTP